MLTLSINQAAYCIHNMINHILSQLPFFDDFISLVAFIIQQLLYLPMKNILIKSESDSFPSSARASPNLIPLLQKLSIKALRSAQNVLEEQVISAMQKKYAELEEEEPSLVSFLEFVIFSLINQVDKLQQAATIDIVKQDYETLQSAVQKSQAEIRKHIRIEQQLKIYLDSLEEKVEELEKKLQEEEGRYSQLFETLREMEEERKELQRKMSKMEEGKDKGKPSSNYTTINEHNYKEYLVGRRSKGSKSKNVIQKFNDRAKKLGEKRDHKTHFIEGAIQINLSNNIVVSKKNSYDQNLNRNPVSNDSSIRELTKTVQMKQPQVTHYERKPNRKISKYKTEIAEELHKKEFRSNSVCN